VQIKAADDTRPTIDGLESLLRRNDLDPSRRERILQELKNVRAGSRTERDAAHEIELHFGDSPHWVTIHDLRFEVGAYSAQIDHILINRLAQVWVCESKHFAEGAVINEHGEWRQSWQGGLGGMKSPVEQAHRQVLLLSRVFDGGLVASPRRLGLIRAKPAIKSLVLVSDNAWIDRPKIKAPWLDEVIKSEHLRTELYDDFDRGSFFQAFRLISKGALRTLGEQLAALHRPSTTDPAAKFGLSSSG
jgi:Nuclease-related domain